MADGQQDPGNGEQANQNNPEPKKFAGKFQSVEEMEKAYQEEEQKLSELNQRLANAEQLLTAFVSNPAQQVPANSSQYIPIAQQQNQQQVDDFGDNFTTEQKEVLKKREQNIVNNLQNQYLQDQQVRATREKFYSKNMDLVGKEPIVQFIAQQVETKKPHLRGDAQLDEIANETKAYIAKLRAGNSSAAAMHVMEPNSSVQNPPQANPEKPKTEAEIFNEALGERKAIHKQALTPIS